MLIDSGSRMPCSIRKISALGVTLVTDQKTPAGSQVAVELGNGQRQAGTVDWAEQREIGIRFDEPVDVLALINRELVSQPVERRSDAASSRCAARFTSNMASISSPRRCATSRREGCRSKASGCPAAGTYIAVFVEGLNIPAGEVVWSRGNLTGIEVFEELSWTSIIPWVREHRCEMSANELTPR